MAARAGLYIPLWVSSLIDADAKAPPMSRSCPDIQMTDLMSLRSSWLGWRGR